MKPKCVLAAASLFLACLLVPQASRSTQPPKHERLPDRDKRHREVVPPVGMARAATRAVQTEALAALKSRQPAARVDFNDLTGVPSWIYVRTGVLTPPDQARATGVANQEPDQPLKSFLNDNRSLFGFGDEALNDARVRREFITSHNQLRTVVWQQELDGLEIFEAVLIAHTTTRGELVNVANDFLPTAGELARGQAARGVDPETDAAAAVRIAAAEVGDVLTDGGLESIEEAKDGAARHQRFRAKPLIGEAEVRLVWLPVTRSELRLCWEVVFTSRVRGELFRSLVDAQTGELWLRRSLTSYVSNATYRVFTSDSPSPYSPGHDTPQSSQPPVVSRTLVTLAALNTNASPGGWINDGANETRGNNVDAHTDWNNDDAADLPRPVGSPFRVFDFPLDLDQPPRASASNAVVQLFYWCNWMHDRLYELGFTEAAGNFQVNNFGRGGLGNDAVSADAQDGGGFNNANMSTPSDGNAPRMQMYVFDGPTPDRDGDYDAEVILHEYTHGLSNRRVGGGVGISELQTAGMGEGWSDFYGLALLASPADDVDGTYAAGGYLTYQFIPGFEANYYSGIRRYPYSTDLTKNPLTFKDIDSTQADPHVVVPLSPLFQPWSASLASEVHNQGEVWCVTLWEARANLIRKHGFAVGNELILRLVTDGMNLCPANPNFLQARDAILQADIVSQGGANLPELWAAFAKRGMGASATSPGSQTTDGVKEAFDLPDDLFIIPFTDLLVTGPVGGPFTPAASVYTLTNQSANLVRWELRPPVGWVTVSATNGTLLSRGPALPLTVGVDPVVNNFPAGIYTEELLFSNHVTQVVQTRRVTLVIGATDYFTELFADADNDLDNQMITFTPNGSGSFYSVCRQNVSAFLTDPSGGVALTLADDSSVPITLTGGATVAIYGNRTGTLYVGSNGYLTQGQGDTRYTESFAAHFDQSRVAALFNDLDPSAGGAVSWRQLGDRVAVTYLNVPDYGNPGSTNRFQIELFFDGRIRLTYLNVGSVGGLVGLSRGNGVPQGFTESDFRAYGNCTLPWSLVAPSAVNESSGILTGQGAVRLSQPLGTNLVVTLASGDLTELTVVNQIVVPAGQTNAVFDLTVVDDLEIDGTQTATLSASAPGFSKLTWPIRVFDDETNSIQLSLPTTAVEDVAPLKGVVSLATAVPVAVVVELVSNDPTELQVPPLVVIAAGRAEAAFTASVINDQEIDGPRTATVTARVQNWSSGSATVTVLDNETAALSVLLPVSAMENRGTWAGGGQVQLSGITLTNLPVSLVSGAPAQLSVPATAIVPAGQSNAFFTLTFINNLNPDGNRSVLVSASAAGFGSASKSLIIVDDDTPPVIVLQPVDQVVDRGSTVAFVVHASGGLPMSHQWWFSNQLSGSVPIIGALGTNLLLADVDFAASGRYWLASTNAFGSVSSARATLTVLPGVTLAEAVDNTNFVWTTTGNGFWRGQTNLSHDAIDAAVSGMILGNQTSSIMTTVTGPGTLSFWWRTSSETGFDYLRFYRSDALLASISGDTVWQQPSYSIPSGTHTLRWSYAKDGSLSVGSDSGWLDQVSFTPTGPPIITAQPQSQVVTIGSNTTFTVGATGLSPLRYQWQLFSTNLPNATNPVLSLVNVQANLAGNYAVRVSNTLGAVSSSTAVLTLNHIPGANPQLVTLPEDGALAITLSGSDADGNVLTYAVVTNPAHGTLSGVSPYLTYRPVANYFGADAFSFVVSDGRVSSAPAIVSLTVQPVADPPIALPQTVTLNEDSTATITLAGTDPDGDSLTFSFAPPAHGALSGSPPVLTYRPATNFSGADGFTFQATDGHFTSPSVAVTINVLPINDAPVARIQVAPLAVFPSVTNQLVISPDGLRAQVGLDGSASSDAENDPLTYRWRDSTNELASAVATTNALNVGAHTVTLEVDDGKTSSLAATSFDVITPAQSLGVIIMVMEESSLDRKLRHALEVTLRAAAASFERGDLTPALNQLRAFQNKVTAQVAPQDATLAAQLNAMAQQLISAVESASGSRP